MNIKPSGYRILVKADPIETETAAGIYIVQDEKLERAAQVYGTVVSLGTAAWKGEEPWAKPGERICYVRHSGKFIKDADGEEFVILNDEDVLCTGV